MPEQKWVKLEFKPGLIKDDTSLASEGGFVGANLVRFSRGRPQVIGGWEDARAAAFTYPVRGAKSWATLAGDKVLAYGTADKLLTLYGGSTVDITPLKRRATLVNPFTTVSGSATVTVADQDHGLKQGDPVTYALATAVGGLTLNGTYTIARVVSIDAYEITAGSNASSSATGGGKVECTVPLDVGNIDGVGGTGYGTGTYGTGLYGYPSGGDVSPRVWSLDNFGADLIAVPRNGALYRYQPILPIPDIATLTEFNNGTGWSGTTTRTATAGTASDLDVTKTGVITGGTIYELVVDLTRSAGTLQFQVYSADLAAYVNLGEAFEASGVYTRRFICPSSPTKINFRKDASFAGSINSMTLRPAATATRLTSAPQYSIGGFVDPNRIMVLYGTIEADGDYNPMLVRWCNQEDIQTWIPDDDNLAGEYSLAKGSRIIGGLASRGQNLISTDEAVYTMRFTGDTASVFQFDLAGSGCGWIGKNAACDVNGRVFWWGRDGNFYVYQGGIPQIIDCPLRRDANDNLAPSQGEKVYCGSNPRYNEVVWMYPDRRLGTECNRMIVYNYVEDHWTEWTLDRTAWVGNGVFDFPVAFSAAGLVYFHERGSTANGDTMPWSLTTGFFDIADGDNVILISRFIPDFEEQAGNINLSFKYRYWPNAPDISFGPYTVTPTTRELLFRHTGRQAQMIYEAGTNAGFVRFGVPRFAATASGARR